MAVHNRSSFHMSLLEGRLSTAIYCGGLCQKSYLATEYIQYELRTVKWSFTYHKLEPRAKITSSHRVPCSPVCDAPLLGEGALGLVAAGGGGVGHARVSGGVGLGKEP